MVDAQTGAIKAGLRFYLACYGLAKDRFRRPEFVTAVQLFCRICVYKFPNLSAES
jgi:hypothetical protein